MTLPPLRPVRPIDVPPRPLRPVPPLLRVARSPFPPKIDAAIQEARRGAAPEVVRQPMTPFLVIQQSPVDTGQRPITGVHPGYHFWYEDVTKPGERNPVPSHGTLYRFHITVNNFGTAPTIMGMVELYGGWQQYPQNAQMFAIKPFTCPAGKAIEVIVETRLPDQVVDGAGDLLVQAYDLMQDPPTHPLDSVNDRHATAIHVNKP